jgi:hypothetical protein
MSAALHLLRPNEQHTRLELVPGTLRALAELALVDVRVVSIVGSARGGKSTLLNLLQRRLGAEVGREVGGGFAVGHTTSAQTEGVWLRLCKLRPDDEFVTALVDSEGLDAPHRASFYDWSISALMALLSDVFVYQTVSVIDATSTERLEMILEVRAHLLGASLPPRGEGAAEEPAASPQHALCAGLSSSFVWLLRDQHLELAEDTLCGDMLAKISPRLRRALPRIFAHVDCLALPRPVEDSALLQSLDAIAHDQLSPAFAAAFDGFERELHAQLLGSARTMGGRRCGSTDLCRLVELFVHAAQQPTGGLARIQHLPPAIEVVQALVGERAQEAAISTYQRLMARAELPMADEALQQDHQRSLAAAMEQCEADLSMCDAEHAQHICEELVWHVSGWAASFDPCCADDLQRLVERKTLQSGLFAALWSRNVRESKRMYDSLLRERSGAMLQQHDGASGGDSDPIAELHRRMEAAIAACEAETRWSYRARRLSVAEFQAEMRVTIAETEKRWLAAERADAEQRLRNEAVEATAALRADVEARISALQLALTASTSAAEAADACRRDDEQQRFDEGEARHRALQLYLDAQLRKLSLASRSAATEAELRMREQLTTSCDALAQQHATHASKAKEEMARLAQRIGSLCTSVEQRLRAEAVKQDLAQQLRVEQQRDALRDVAASVVSTNQAMVALVAKHSDATVAHLAKLDKNVSSLWEALGTVSQRMAELSKIIETSQATTGGAAGSPAAPAPRQASGLL